MSKTEQQMLSIDARTTEQKVEELTQRVDDQRRAIEVLIGALYGTVLGERDAKYIYDTMRSPHSLMVGIKKDSVVRNSIKKNSRAKK